jgi:hypothetical protein
VIQETKYNGVGTESVAYSDLSTTATLSPFIYRSSNFSVQKLEPIIEIRPVLEEMFKVTGSGRRVALIPAPVPISTAPQAITEVVRQQAVEPLRPQRVIKKKSDESIQRLAKIAKYKL